MKTFRFRLARALIWYEERCKAEESRLRAAASALESINQSILRLCGERESIERATVFAVTVSAPDLLSLARFQKHSRERESVLRSDLLVCQTAFAKQRTAVQEARRRVRLIEKLRERRLAEYSYAAELELEQLAADAFQSAASARRTGLT